MKYEPISPKLRFAHSAHGSYSLGALFALFGGVLFTMLFHNITRYITATNAVEQAAREVSRCVTPTDGKCYARNAQTSAQLMDWYSEAKLENPGQREVYALRGTYSASMTRQTWSATAGAYEVNYITPQALATLYELPIMRYSSASSAFEYRSADIIMSATQPIYRANFSRFPGFERNYEDYYRTRNASSWSLYALDGSGRRTGASDFEQLQDTGYVGPIRVDDDDKTAFNFGWVTVPAMDGAGSSSVRRGKDGSKFNSSPFDDQSDWFKTARLVIKLQNRFTFLDSARNGARAELKIDDFNLRACDQPGGKGRCTNRDLGGIVNTSFSKNSNNEPNYFNPWVRGPGGAHGGDPSEGHSEITVPRGGSYRFSFTARVGGNSLLISRRIRVWYDSYRKIPGASVERTCMHSQLTPAQPDAAAQCPATAAECGFARGYEKLDCRLGPISTQAVCTDPGDGKVFTAASGNGSGNSITAVSCDSTWRPTFPAASGNQVCGASAVMVGTVKALPPASCAGKAALKPVALEDQPAATCAETNNGSLDRNGRPSFENCPALKTLIASLNAKVDSGNSKMSAGFALLPHFSPNDFRWTDETAGPGVWRKQWDPALVDSTGIAVANPAAQREVSCTVPMGEKPIYKRKLGALPPSARGFNFDQNSCNLPAPSTTTLAKLASEDRLRFSLISEIPVPIDQVYPFKKSAQPSLAIPYWGPNSYPAMDYDLDPNCNLETSCSGPHREFPNLEAALRSYAAVQIPEANDAELLFTYAEPAYQLAKVTAEESKSLTACSPVASACNVGTHQFNTTYLGRFPAHTFPQGPVECTSNSSMRCYSMPVSSESPLLEVNNKLDAGMAEAAGFSALQRYFPQAQQNCAGAECMNVTVDTESSNTAEIIVSYNMPVSFPWSIMLNRDFVPVAYGKKEVEQFDVASW